MNSRKQKMIAPVVVTVLMVIYYVLYFGLLISLVSGFWKFALGILPLAMTGVTVKVCIERIKEIKEGEEDDLSQY